MNLGKLVDRLNERLGIEAYRDTDVSLNGLQVGDRGTDVQRVVGAVDAALGPIDRAIDHGADLIVVHHGLLWGDAEPLTGHRFERVSRLIEADVALYTAHLPLDGHQQLGNAAHIADRLGMRDREPFPDPTAPVGTIGSVSGDADDLLEGVANTVDRDVSFLQTLGPEPAAIDRVAIVTGSGTGYIEAAVEAGADVLITGEGKHSAFHTAADVGLPVVLAGHYATETAGVRATLGVLEGWDLDTVFVDVPTGI